MVGARDGRSRRPRSTRCARDVVVTYAEAGGWGRALVLECRRRGIPLAGLQHGFIYRHWLNYLHEPDEMLPIPREPADAGFPLPTLTLLFDELRGAIICATAGRFPARRARGHRQRAARRARARAGARSRADDIERARARALARGADEPLVLVVAEVHARSAAVLPALRRRGPRACRACSSSSSRIRPKRLTPTQAAAGGVANVRVAPRGAPLAPLLAAARARRHGQLDRGDRRVALGVPSLVIGLPNNLTPFVDAGCDGRRGGAGGDRAGARQAPV